MLATLIALACTWADAVPPVEEPTVVHWAVYHSEIRAPEGVPPSGEFDGTGVRRGAPRFHGQPVQGFSGVQTARGADWYRVLSDNGFGTQSNSPDYLLGLYTFEDTRRAPVMVVHDHLLLSDPGRQMPWRIAREYAADRRLTGADFDLESFVELADGSFWVGDEFGPFLLHFNAQGELLAPPVEIPLALDGAALLRSPQHPALLARPVGPGEASPANVVQSGGFEGMAAPPDQSKLHALLEKPLPADEGRRLRLYSFDLAAGAFTDIRYYPLDEAATAIGDMATINEHEYLVIERDNGHGPEAAFKKIMHIDLREVDVDGTLVKTEVADLMNLAVDDAVADVAPVFRNAAGTSRFRFPYFTIEGLAVVHPRILLVLNDNNYPADGARQVGQPDPSEWVWVALPEPLSVGE